MVEVVSARRSHTRDRLVDAAVAVFAEKGVLGASVEEICEAAGFTRGAFYSNFDSKDALCLALLERQAAGNMAGAHSAIAALPSASQPGALGLDDLIHRAIGVFLATQPGDRASVLAGIELRLYAVRSESLRPGYLAFVDRISAEFLSLLERTLSDFGFRLTVPGAQALAVLQGVLEQGAVNALLRGEPDDNPDLATLLGRVLRSLIERV